MGSGRGYTCHPVSRTRSAPRSGSVGGSTVRKMRNRGDLAVGLLASAGAVAWGLVLATAVSVASMLAFNWFFLPPTHTFQLRDGANWAVLAVYLVTAAGGGAPPAPVRGPAALPRRAR